MVSIVEDLKGPQIKSRGGQGSFKGINRVGVTRLSHFVQCSHCGKEFDLILARWCACRLPDSHPSKICPQCGQCICLYPGYLNDSLWGEAPRFLKRHGFTKLFYLYL